MSELSRAADDLNAAFNDPFWRGSSVQRSIGALADFMKKIEASKAVFNLPDLKGRVRYRPRVRVKMGRKEI